MSEITITFDELERQKHSSVTDYCRFLMELNPERYQDMSVAVYRGKMKCLTVSSVKYGASVEPDVGNARWRLYVPQEPV